MKRLLYRIYLLISVLSTSLAGMASADVDYRYFNVESGLSSNSILDIESDNYGYLWVATVEGLNIISGDRVQKIYKSDGNIELPGNELNCLLNDSERNIMWVGTQRDGIAGFNYLTGESKYFHKGHDRKRNLSGNAITSLALDADHNLWVGTYFSGINHINMDTGLVTRYDTGTVPGLKSDKIWSIAYDSDRDIIYVGHERGGFSEIYPSRLQARTYTVDDGLPDNTVRKVLPDGNYVWVCTDRGVTRFDRSTKKFHNFGTGVYTGRCRDAIKTDRGILLAYEDFGTVLLDGVSGEFLPTGAGKFDNESFKVPQVLKISEPNRLFENHKKNIIIGTSNHGLIAVSHDNSYFTADHLSFFDIERNENSEAANVINIETLDDGSVWIATKNMGVHNKNYLNSDRNIMGSAHIASMTADSSGSLWICDREGILTVYDTLTGKESSHNIGIRDYDWIGLYAFGDSIWISSNSGIYVFDSKKKTIVSHHDVGNNLTREIAKDKHGNIYVATFGQGLATFDKNMKPVASYKTETGFPSNTVNDILVDNVYVWVATGEGLVRLESGRFGKFETVGGITRSVRSLVKDRKGNLWFATTEGLGVIQGDDKVLYFERELPMRDFNISSSAIDRDGRLYFGSPEGVLSFQPDYILDKKNLSVPVISGLTLDGDTGTGNSIVAVSGKKDISLSHSQNNFTVVVSCLDLFRQGETFEYRMMGLDDKWYPVGEDNKVSFRGLPYGKYIFEARNTKSTDEESSTSLEIEIIPPFWLSWWAKLIYLLFSIGLILMIAFRYKARLRHQTEESLRHEKEIHFRELQEERMAFFTNITHELRTPLTLISGPLDDLVRSETLDKDDKWKIGLIHKNTQRLLQLVNQILDFRKTETRNKRLCVCRENIVKTVGETSMKFVELNRNRDVNISVCSERKVLEVYYDREVLTMILDNLLSNAMKYTESGEISVRVSVIETDGNQWVCISVADTGHGISEEALPHIFDRYYQEKSSYQAAGTGIGLALVKSLVELHHGLISVKSEVGKGTCFEILLPKDEEYPEAMHTQSDSSEKKEEDNRDSNDDPVYGDHIMVLVVEDNPDILDYVEKSLSGIYDVKTAANGQTGLECARKYVPDVIVTDIMMPVMNGVEMCRRLKNDVTTSHIPVVMLTAKDSVTEREEGYSAGADSYLTKPFNASLLITRINNIILRRNSFAEYLRDRSPRTVSDNETPPIQTDGGSRTENFSKLDREFLEKLDGIILAPENAGNVNIELLTDRMFMSKATLYRKMKSLTGMSPNEYIRQLRVAKARDYMMGGDKTLGEIADLLGFSSQSYFRESFKAVYGMTPSAYIKSVEDKNN